MRALLRLKLATADATLADLKKLGFAPEASGPLPSDGQDAYVVIGNVPIERWFDVKGHAGVADISADVRVAPPDPRKN